MTEIEKAIEYLQGALTSCRCAECSEGNAVVKTAITALREKLEREKECEYCKQVITTVKMDFETDSILGEDKWFSSTRAPKFCPMCGRRLKEA